MSGWESVEKYLSETGVPDVDSVVVKRDALGELLDVADDTSLPHAERIVRIRQKVRDLLRQS